jgi:ubiquitin-conjugating enzyme E2 Q
MSEVRAFQSLNQQGLGFTAMPENNNLYEWSIRWTGFDASSPLGCDMARYQRATGRGYVQLRMTFPRDFPSSPPFMRVLQPRFAFHTGHVTVGGSICSEILTAQAWRPDFKIEGMLMTIFADVAGGKPRLDLRAMNIHYSIAEAVDAFKRMSRVHGWSISGWFPRSDPINGPLFDSGMPRRLRNSCIRRWGVSMPSTCSNHSPGKLLMLL